MPYINGKLRWEWEPIYKIAIAVRQAAKEQQVPIRWGGAWDQLLTESDEAPEDMLADYGARRRRAGKKPFYDGPHYELPASDYPA